MGQLKDALLAQQEFCQYTAKMLTIYVVVILHLIQFRICYSGKYYGGIPVPGRSVPPIRILELYAKSCVPNDRSSAAIKQLSDLLRNVDASEIASNLYNSLYLAVGDIDVDKMMGKWFMVVDTPSVHREYCPTFYFELLDKTLYTATFTVRQYSRNSENMQILEGYGRKVGPDPAELLINTGHPADPCPYSIIRTGPLNENDQYVYVILTQPLKYPTIVLARDPLDFESNYKQQVKEFLENQRFLNPSTPFENSLVFLNTTECFKTAQYNIGFR